MRVSVVIPVHNEAKNIPVLFQELHAVFSSKNFDHQIVFVNDGSADNTAEVLEKLAVEDPSVSVINFRKNFGQTAALAAGIKYSDGDVIVTMDGDLQNNPADIPVLVQKISEGYDVVSGWRFNRHDKLISRKIPSWLANRLIAAITGVRIHDYGCTLKAYRGDVVREIHLYGEMHRFIAAYVAWQGGRVAEIVVDHRSRKHGQTHYGISRTFKVLLDLLLAKFLSTYFTRPIHFFGGIGMATFLVGFLCGAVAVALRLAGILHLVETPLPTLSALFIIVGVQFVALGVISEILMRIYFESQNKETYLIKNKLNIR